MILPLPRGQTMAFRRAFLDIGDVPDAEKRFEIGSRSGAHPHEKLVPVRLSGGFTAEGGRSDALYFIGMYKVTRNQFTAIKNADTENYSPPPDGEVPQTNLTRREAEEAIHKWNDWLRKNALSKMPKDSSVACKLRPPTETDRELVARRRLGCAARVRFNRRRRKNRDSREFAV